MIYIGSDEMPYIFSAFNQPPAFIFILITIRNYRWRSPMFVYSLLIAHDYELTKKWQILHL